MHEPLPHRSAPATGVAHTLHRDYETRSNANLPKVGVDKYAAERGGDDRAKAVTALTHRLLADETLRQALVEPIIRNIAVGSIATVVHHRRGAE
jgi:hypothetical protein